jgi:transposase
MDKFIGLDDHGASCTFGVVGPSGRKLRHDVVETNGAALVDYLCRIAGRKHLCLEEGARSAWLYEILSPHVEEVVVAGISKSRGQKSDAVDAFRRAEELRTGSIKTSVFKAPGEFGRLRQVARVHGMLVGDVVRVKSRLKAQYRARGVATPGKGIYGTREREAWLGKLPAGHRWATEKLHEECEVLHEFRKAAEEELVRESRRHPIARVLTTAPGMGPIRVAQLLPIVVTPHRFRTRQQFWAYCGLGIVMRSSSDWVRTESGGWVRGQVQQTRGLNWNHNARLKGIFKGAAMTIVTMLPDDPLHDHYLRLTTAGTKPNLARLTIARRVAAIVLRMWKDGKEYEPQKLRATQQEEIASPAH